MMQERSNSTSIVVMGPSSTGKTTLCTALAQRLNLEKPAFVTEVARHVMVAKGYSRETIGLLQMQQDIMDAHFVQEEVAACYPISLCDRSAIDPIIYSILTSPNEDEARRRQTHLTSSSGFQKALELYRQSVVVLLKPVQGWLVDDGVRTTEDQEQCLAIFQRVLKELNISYFEIGDSVRYLPERVQMVVDFARL